MKMCLNWKVLVGLAALAVGILLVVPGLLPAALPLLLVAVCPISMLVMALGMGKMNECSTQRPLAPETAIAFEDKTTRLSRELADLDARRAEVAADLRAVESTSAAPRPTVNDARATRESESRRVNEHARSIE